MYMHYPGALSKVPVGDGASGLVPGALPTSAGPRRPQGATLQAARPSAFARRGISMVEILVVIVIIGVLLSSVLVASSVLINKSRTTSTQSLLAVVQSAVEEFKREQTQRPTIARSPAYKKRYGLYPPDELEVFGAGGFRGIDTTRSLAPGNAKIVPDAPVTGYSTAMRFYADGTDADALEHRDLAAMIVAIETLGDASRSILEKIPERNRTAGPLKDDEPAQFLDRDGGGDWSADDLQIRYITDDWGNPISYLAQRDWTQATGTDTESKNLPGWNEASTEIIRLNGGEPVFFSYGPDGKDQLKAEAMGPNGAASLIGDFEIDELPYRAHVIDNEWNADNVYSNPDLAAKLAKGIE